MSAYIVSDGTINTILSCIGDSESLATFRYLLEADGFDISGPAWLQRLGEAMLTLNTAAVRSRYPNDADGDLPGSTEVEDFAYIYQLRRPLEGYKAVKHLLYQCNEGDSHRSLLYQFLRTVERFFAATVICRMPEYETARYE